MSNDATESYLSERICDGLKLAASSAKGLGVGGQKESDASLHASFLSGLRIAEQACRQIGHARGARGQGIAWIKMGTKLGNMLDASTKAAAQSAFLTVNQAPKTGRGKAWLLLGDMLENMAASAQKAVAARSDVPLMILGREQMN